MKLRLAQKPEEPLDYRYNINAFFTEEHAKELPDIRLKKAVINNFKNVEHGEIVFKSEPEGCGAELLGIYGQNGSGKTAFIEALAILEILMAGERSVSFEYGDSVTVGKEYAELEFVFEMRYPDKKYREATYSFCLKSRDKSAEELREEYSDVPENLIPISQKKVTVFNEKFYLQWEDSPKRQLIIDTSSEDNAFVPDTKRKILAGKGKKAMIDLEVNKQFSDRMSISFIFQRNTLALFKAHDENNVFYKALVELSLYASRYLFVIETRSTAWITQGLLPITGKGTWMPLSLQDVTLRDTDIEFAEKITDNISLVLSQMVPGLTIGFKELSKTLTDKGEPAAYLMPVSRRDGKELPLRCESEGVRKIISVLLLIVAAFNDPSVTVAVDEFDSGVYEYLLGEILQALEESGKGQFIFTSHNLRPLEVINKKFLYFTTTNPRNRYIRLKNIAATNNLRDTYFREIIMNEQVEELYKQTKRHRIIAAIKKAGGLY